MKILLEAKHWQLFVLMFALPFILQKVVPDETITLNNISMMTIIYNLIGIISGLIYFAWIWSIGININNILKLKIDMEFKYYNILRFKIKMNAKLFKSAVIYFPVYFVLLFVFTTLERNNIYFDDNVVFNMWYIIIPFHLLAMLSLIYSIYYCYKIIKTIKIKKLVIFGIKINEFFLLFCYPIGIWYIQPRINSIYEKDNNETNPEQN